MNMLKCISSALIATFVATPVLAHTIGEQEKQVAKIVQEQTEDATRKDMLNSWKQKETMLANFQRSNFYTKEEMEILENLLKNGYTDWTTGIHLIKIQNMISQRNKTLEGQMDSYWETYDRFSMQEVDLIENLNKSDYKYMVKGIKLSEVLLPQNLSSHRDWSPLQNSRIKPIFQNNHLYSEEELNIMRDMLQQGHLNWIICIHITKIHDIISKKNQQTENSLISSWVKDDQRTAQKISIIENLAKKGYDDMVQGIILAEMLFSKNLSPAGVKALGPSANAARDKDLQSKLEASRYPAAQPFK